MRIRIKNVIKHKFRKDKCFLLFFIAAGLLCNCHCLITRSLCKKREIKPCCRSPLSFLTRQCRPLTPICWIPFALLNSSGVSLHEKTHRTSIVQEICFQISSSMLIVSNNNPKRKKRNSLSFLVFEWKITSCVSAPSFHFIGLCAWFFWAFDFLVRAFQLVDWASQSARQPVEFSLSLSLSERKPWNVSIFLAWRPNDQFHPISEQIKIARRLPACCSSSTQWLESAHIWSLHQSGLSPILSSFTCK